MNHKRFYRLSALALAAALSLSACGERGGGESTAGGDGDGGKKIVKIGVIAPLSGDLAPMGNGIKNSVELAAKQANEAGTIPGYEIQVVAMDDEAKPEIGQNAATSLSGDDQVIGVVGTLNSSVALTVAPILDQSKIVMVSPANTGPALTRGDNAADSPKRVHANYFRTCTNDLVQGPFAAKYLYDQGITKVATIHDKKAYGQGLVTEFTKEFEKLGGEIVAAETVNPEESNFSSVISAIKPKSPAAVYYGGEYPVAGPLSKQLKDAGLKIPLMGGDGLYDGKYIEFAGDQAAGDLATSVGAPIETLDSGKKFVESYAAAKYSQGYSAYGAYGYDAANAIIEATKVGLKDKSVKDSRSAVIEAMGAVKFQGATGDVAFDEYGDTTARTLTAYKVEGGKWVPAHTDTL